MRHYPLVIHLSVLMTALLTTVCFAKPLNLYDQPKADAKIIGKIESEENFIPIFATKEGDFIKVGDPKNGNVGWLKQSELKSITGLSYSQQMVYSSSPPNGITIIQYGNQQKLSKEQARAMIKGIEERQLMMHRHMQVLMDDLYSNFPVMVPVVFYPEHFSKRIKPAAQANSTKQSLDGQKKLSQTLNDHNKSLINQSDKKN